MAIRGVKFGTYNLPVDINSKETRIRHLMDFENMEKTIDRIENKQGRVTACGQPTTETI